jgi:glutamate--glyoxylate aminotransferase
MENGSNGRGSDGPGRIEGYALHPSTVNSRVREAQYAVRGELYNKAQELSAKGKDIIYTNGT